eukprot:scaffold7.g3754.t1
MWEGVGLHGDLRLATQPVSLRAFQPHFRQCPRAAAAAGVPGGSGAWAGSRGRRAAAAAHRARHAAATAQELLAGAVTLPLPALTPVLEADAVPPPERWASHGDLLAGCEPGAAPLRVALLLSGGVDSSLALHLLRAAGHEEDFRNSWDACPWEEDLSYCRQVCAQLGVPLEIVPLTAQYWDRVVAHCLGEIRAGRTPNPDVLCNSRVKFGAFFEHLEAAHGGRFDRIASGHYARLLRPAPGGGGGGGGGEGTNGGIGGGGHVALALTPDAVKDQTYFLAHLSQAQLARTMFPLGCLAKAQVRALAAAARLPNQARRDSQGICFLGKVQFSEFVAEHLGEWPGPIVEEESGNVLGYHRGFWFHTVGQRRGVPLSGGPWYVARKDPRANTVYVSCRYHDSPKRRDAFACGAFSWTSPARPDPRAPLYVKVRHGPHAYTCALELEGCEGPAQVGRVAIDGNDQGLAAGQFAAFYQGVVCLGSAVILGGESHVVTAVVQRPTDGRVLLVQRSDKVGSFKLHWGGVSGFIEPGADWVLLSDLAALQTVARLDETLARLILPPSQEDKLALLAADRAHGAAELAVRAVEALGREAQRAACGGGGGDEEGPAAFEQLRNFGYALATCRPSMPAIANAVAAVLAEAQRDLQARATAFPPSRVEAGAAVVRAARAALAELLARGTALRRAVRGLLRDGQTVMTLSRSSSVETAVVEAAAEGLRLSAIVCESRPLCEGAALARTWAAAGVDVTVITDAQAAIFAPRADVVLLGADRVTERAVHNKAGSALLALAARAAGVPVYAAADTGKLSAGGVSELAHPSGGLAAAGEAREEGEEEMAPEEVVAAWSQLQQVQGQQAEPLPASVRVRNVYFEAVPWELLSGGLVTEEGRLEAAAVHERLAALRATQRLAFDIRDE